MCCVFPDTGADWASRDPKLTQLGRLQIQSDMLGEASEMGAQRFLLAIHSPMLFGTPGTHWHACASPSSLAPGSAMFHFPLTSSFA